MSSGKVKTEMCIQNIEYIYLSNYLNYISAHNMLATKLQDP